MIVATALEHTASWTPAGDMNRPEPDIGIQAHRLQESCSIALRARHCRLVRTATIPANRAHEKRVPEPSRPGRDIDFQAHRRRESYSIAPRAQLHRLGTAATILATQAHWKRVPEPSHPGRGIGFPGRRRPGHYCIAPRAPRRTPTIAAMVRARADSQWAVLDCQPVARVWGQEMPRPAAAAVPRAPQRRLVPSQSGIGVQGRGRPANCGPGHFGRLRISAAAQGSRSSEPVYDQTG